MRQKLRKGSLVKIGGGHRFYLPMYEKQERDNQIIFTRCKEDFIDFSQWECEVETDEKVIFSNSLCNMSLWKILRWWFTSKYNILKDK